MNNLFFSKGKDLDYICLDSNYNPSEFDYDEDPKDNKPTEEDLDSGDEPIEDDWDEEVDYDSDSD